MKRDSILVAAVLGVMGLTAPVAGQARAGVRGQGAEQMERTADPAVLIQGALRASERLELTESQVTALEGIRDRARAGNEVLSEQMRSLRQEMADGDITRNQIRERMTALAEQRREATAPLRQEVDDVLSAEQQARLRQVSQRGRAIAGAANARRNSEVERRRGQSARPGVGDAARLRSGGVRNAPIARMGANQGARLGRVAAAARIPIRARAVARSRLGGDIPQGGFPGRQPIRGRTGR